MSSNLSGSPRFSLSSVSSHSFAKRQSCFTVSIESCIDIASHIIASENYRFPKDNADSFAVLGEHGVLDGRFAATLGATACFRNRVVHVYWDVGDQQVRDYLETSLTDFDRFARDIAGHRW